VPRTLYNDRYRHGDPWAHVNLYALFRPASDNMALRLTLLQQEEQRPLQKEMETEDPLAPFLCTL
jgi:hypothetical protein